MVVYTSSQSAPEMACSGEAYTPTQQSVSSLVLPPSKQVFVHLLGLPTFSGFHRAQIFMISLLMDLTAHLQDRRRDRAVAEG